MDDEVIDEFKEKLLKETSNKYDERVVKNVREAIEVIREHSRSHLILVGRMPEGELAAAMRQKSECPEMGPVGNLLISPEFSTSASVLVVQQYHTQLSMHSLASLKDDEVTTDQGDYESN